MRLCGGIALAAALVVTYASAALGGTFCAALFLIPSNALIALGAAASAPGFDAPEPRQADLLLAYVDPGSAGFIIVSVLGFLSAVGYTLRNAFGRLRAWLRRRT